MLLVKKVSNTGSDGHDAPLTTSSFRNPTSKLCPTSTTMTLTVWSKMMPRLKRLCWLRIPMKMMITLSRLMIYIDTYGLRVTSNTCKVIASCYLDTTSLILLLFQGSHTTTNASVSPPKTWTNVSTACEAPCGVTDNERSEAESPCASSSNTRNSRAMSGSFASYFLPPTTGD